MDINYFGMTGYKKLSLMILLVIGGALVVVSLVLWLAVGLQVGLQESKLQLNSSYCLT